VPRPESESAGDLATSEGLGLAKPDVMQALGERVLDWCFPILVLASTIQSSWISMRCLRSSGKSRFCDFCMAADSTKPHATNQCASRIDDSPIDSEVPSGKRIRRIDSRLSGYVTETLARSSTRKFIAASAKPGSRSALKSVGVGRALGFHPRGAATTIPATIS
jgi:hypothetical protein